MRPHHNRRQALRGRLAEASLDGLLVTGMTNVRFLTGFTGSAGALMVTAESEHLATDGRYQEQAEGQAPDVARTITRTRDWLTDHVTAGMRLGVESHLLPWDAARSLADLLPDAEIVPAPNHVEELRAAKDDVEVAAIARACAIADAAFADLCGWLAPGMTERQVARRLDGALLDCGAHDRSFETIVASGPASALPHHRPDDRVLGAGDLVLCDFGALVDGYHSDMTRTVALGEPTTELRRAYEVVSHAQQAGLDALGEDVEAGVVDSACRDAIAAHGLGEHFLHPTGHGVGLDIHEQPIIGPEATAIIRSRMVVTVEPGVYLPGLGGVRIEDTVAIEPSGARVLSTAPKDLLIL